MNPSTLLLGLLLQAPPSVAPVPRITFVVDFERENEGDWSFFGNPANPVEVIEAGGGNPGAFLHSTCSGLACLDTFAPELRTQLGTSSVFTGDYRAKGVEGLGVDLAIFDVDFSTGGRPLTLMLRHDPGTPGDSFDDTVVYRLGPKNIPDANGQWRRYSFRVPSEKLTLPAGWLVFQGSGDDDADWNQVMTGVSQVSFFYGDPTFFFIFQQWELGVDNLRIRLDQGAL
jgi:hypothetical protein